MAFSDQPSEVTWQHFHSTLGASDLEPPESRGGDIDPPPPNERSPKTHYLFKALPAVTRHCARPGGSSCPRELAREWGWGRGDLQ